MITNSFFSCVLQELPSMSSRKEDAAASHPTCMQTSGGRELLDARRIGPPVTWTAAVEQRDALSLSTSSSFVAAALPLSPSPLQSPFSRYCEQFCWFLKAGSTKGLPVSLEYVRAALSSVSLGHRRDITSKDILIFRLTHAIHLLSFSLLLFTSVHL